MPVCLSSCVLACQTVLDAYNHSHELSPKDSLDRPMSVDSLQITCCMKIVLKAQLVSIAYSATSAPGVQFR